MSSLFPFFHRLMDVIRCFGKRRYGYLDRSFLYVPSGRESLFLILSPDFYRITMVSLPVATASEALRYAPSYFELRNEHRIHYEAYKLENGRYLLAACDLEVIRRHLETVGIEPSSVEYFVLSQGAFGVDMLPVALSDGAVLAVSDGVVVRLPSHYVSEPIQSNVEEALQKLLPCISAFKADMHAGEIPTSKTLRVSAILSAIIVVNFLIHGVVSYREGNRILEEQEELRISKHLPETQMELDALSGSWEKKEKEQIKLRKIIAAFGTLSLEHNVTVPLAVSTASATNSIVLVPGSNPSERNLLLIPGDTNATLRKEEGEYVSSLAYEEGAVTFLIHTASGERAKYIRDLAAKTLKSNAVSVKGTSVEGSIR